VDSDSALRSAAEGRGPSSGGPASAASRRILIGVLGVSLLLRILLILSGGQDYWPDELRYGRSRVAVHAMRTGAWASAREALSSPDHFLFAVMGLLPAALEPSARLDSRVPALFFALFSVASILLIYGILRRLGEDARASCLGAFLLAAATTHLYYSRHLLPYDAALAFGLFALYAGLEDPASVRASVLCGLLSCAAFLTYNGYWLLSGSALLVHALRRPRTARSRSRLIVRRGIASGAAFCLPLAALVGADHASGGHLARDWIRFSGTVSQGIPSEGWKLPLAFLWHAEHSIALLWAAACLVATWRIVRGDRHEGSMVGVAGVALIYGSLVLVSVALGRMVVYGRLVRQLVPFACIVTAAILGRLWSASPRARLAVAGVLAAVLVQAAVNFHRPLTQVFPREFRVLAQREAARVGSPTLVLYADHIYPVPLPVPAAGPTILARPHPLQFLPYQYEGYTPAERAILRNTDIRMRLVLAGPGFGEPSR